MQGGASWSFFGSELFIYSRSKVEDFSKSLNLFQLRIIFRSALIYKDSIGASLKSVAALCFEFCMCEGSLWETEFHENLQK